MQRFNPGAEVMARYRGAQAQVFVTVFNDAPPQTSHVADEVILFYKPTAPTVMLALFNIGCIVASGDMPMYLVIELMAEAEREI